MTGLEFGRRFDNQPLCLPWPYCPHVLIGGETGSGKSGVCNALIGAAAELPNVALCGVDLKLVELWPWRDRFTTLATTPAEADQLLVDLRRLIRDRAEFLMSHGHRKWQPHFGPWLIVVLDELAELQSLDADALVTAVTEPKKAGAAIKAGREGRQVRVGLLGSLARLARFCGVTIIAATQYPSVEVVDQQIRSQLTIRIMLRVASAEQVAVVLGQGYGSTIRPSSIGPSERGGLWVVGLPERITPIRGRAHWVTDQGVANRVAETRHLTPTTAEVFAPLPLTPVGEVKR